MATKSDILNNLREYTADEIVEAIKAGTVTVYELSKSGNLTPLMRRRIEERLAAKTTETTPAAQEVAPTVEDAPTLNIDEDSSEDVEIPEAVDMDIPSEITIPEAPVVTQLLLLLLNLQNKRYHQRRIPLQYLIRECSNDLSLLMEELEEPNIAYHSLSIRYCME